MSASLRPHTSAVEGSAGGAAEGRAWDAGSWTGGFFGQTTNGYPAAVLGEFHVATGAPQVEQHDTGFIGISGAFGAHATNE